MFYDRISRHDAARQIEDTWDGWSTYLNTETGKFITVPDPGNDYADLDPDEIPDVSGKEFVCLPGQYEIHEKSIMEDFAAGLADGDIRNRLFHALTHSHPYRSFKDVVAWCGIADEYYAFRLKAYERIAEDWCRYNDILFTC